MKHRFNKEELPFLDETFKNEKPRNYFWLARKIEEGKHFTPNRELAIFAYEKGANMGDDWCMHALFLRLLHDPRRFPEALSWLYKCIKAGNPTVAHDLYDNWSFIYDRCMNFSLPENEPYANIELRCSLLACMLLLHFGNDNWEDIDLNNKKFRAQDLVDNLCKVLKIDPITLSVEDYFKDWKGTPYADGLTYAGSHKIAIKTSSFLRYDRFVVVLFHELGHHVIHAMMHSPEPKRTELLNLYGLTEDHIEKWKQNEKGYAVTLTEEDPDTLSYGVWMTYRLLFF